MDDTIRDTLRGIQARDPEAAAVVAEKPAETTEAKSERLRDPTGKFAAPASEPVASTVAESAPVTVPPELQRLGLNKDEAAAYATASPVLQAAFQRRIDETLSGVEQYKTDAQYGKTLQAVIAPYTDNIRAAGVTPEVAIGKLMEIEGQLRNGTPETKSQIFAQLAADYGIQIQGTQQLDPTLQAMQQELRQVKGTLQQFQTQGEQQRQQELNSQIDAFKADQNHKHFDAVRGYMGALIQAGHAPDLQSAYEQAVWANPVTRADAIAQQQEAARVDADQKAKAAREAASVNTRQRPTLPTAPPINADMTEDIRATYRRLVAA